MNGEPALKAQNFFASFAAFETSQTSQIQPISTSIQPIPALALNSTVFFFQVALNLVLRYALRINEMDSTPKVLENPGFQNKKGSKGPQVWRQSVKERRQDQQMKSSTCICGSNHTGDKEGIGGWAEGSVCCSWVREGYDSLDKTWTQKPHHKENRRWLCTLCIHNWSRMGGGTSSGSSAPGFF